VSNEAITWAYQQPITTGAKFVLVALADLADEGHSCYPGQAKLASMTGQGERTVRRQLLELQAAGYLARMRRFDAQGHRTSDRYVLAVGQVIPTGQNGHRPDRPAARSTSGQNDLRPFTTVLPAIDDSPTGQNGQVSLREPLEEPLDTSSEIPISDASITEIRPDVERLCTQLADAIQTNGSRRPKITLRWREACRLMLDRDGRSEEQISRAIAWCQTDEFWRANVLSMPKLRDQYDRLRLAAQRPTARASPRRGVGSATATQGAWEE